MIVIAIIGILAAIASSQYSLYAKRTKFAEVISATAPYKSAVSLCVQDFNVSPITNCGAGSNGVPKDIITATGDLQDLIVTADGKITATGAGTVDQADYILTPTYAPSTSSISWVVSGSCDGKSTGKTTILCQL